MRSFDEIYDMAQHRQDGAEALEARLVAPREPSELAQIGDDRWLAQISKSIYSARFSHALIDRVWGDFEEAFHAFDIEACALMDDAQLDRMAEDKRLWRRGTQPHAVRDNAVMMLNLAEEYGTAAEFFADWPSDDFVGLLHLLKKNGRRLLGLHAQRAMREMGVDGFILDHHLRARLITERVIDANPKTRAEMQDVQDALNIWSAQSGRSISEVSQVCALSINSHFRGRQTPWKRFHKGRQSTIWMEKKAQAQRRRHAAASA
ncbi:DNA-3-methyladenine glycosylase [Candidatus Rhodobacter oscarellae]|uniref:DNA-3-methyladenine glycosylase n=1 Tax=Candidatus Rhodobacter oscarellae TaxID=1675527 RepID=A0A0J9E4P1_9RHOB|nr:DNA-3-methyladenine glycosylase I [Candidatus Rhodobacter lobularis]KMW56789.1 DNA-3-methyladenine glycosylase [Candidatus Rhodobacter lobularis]